MTVQIPLRRPESDNGSGTRKIRVALIDDHSVVRVGLKTLINAQPDMQVVGEASDGKHALDVAHSLQPDLMVVDVSLPDITGTEVTQQVRTHYPAIRVLALTMFEDRSYIRSLLEAGASGYVLKRSAGDELVRAIRAVMNGRTYLDPSLSLTLAQVLLRGTPGKTGQQSPSAPAELSDREKTVLQLIAQGFLYKEIAAELAVSIKSVETYKTRAMEKLELDSRAAVVRYALEQGWLRSGD